MFGGKFQISIGFRLSCKTPLIFNFGRPRGDTATHREPPRPNDYRDELQEFFKCHASMINKELEQEATKAYFAALDVM